MKPLKQSIIIVFSSVIFCQLSNSQDQNIDFVQQDSVLQQENSFTKNQNDFWKRMRFGGAFGVVVGSNYTSVTVAPSAVYQINKYIATGIGIQETYINQKSVPLLYQGYKANIYGGSLIVLVDPIRQLQLSTELEQLRINVKYSNGVSRNSWNTALFVGAGYKPLSFLAIGVKYNVLHNNKNNIYKEAFSPFVQIYF